MLDAGHLRSWRWFLVMAVATYGLLPRLVLLGLSTFTQRRVLASLPFTHQRTQALYARMLTPSLETASTASGTGPRMPIPEPMEPLTAPAAARRPASSTEPSGHSADKAETQTPGQTRQTAPKPVEQGPTRRPTTTQATEVKPAPAAITADACVLMIHIDVADVLEASDRDRLQRMLVVLAGWRVAVSAIIGGGSAMADQAISLVQDGQWEAPPPRIAIIQDGSQPPITEHLRFLRKVRAAAGDQAQILLALIGDPDGGDPLPPLSEFHFNDWERKIKQMGDPYLRLAMLAPPTGEAASSHGLTDKAPL